MLGETKISKGKSKETNHQPELKLINGHEFELRLRLLITRIRRITKLGNIESMGFIPEFLSYHLECFPSIVFIKQCESEPAL